jgi:hypothetical protein
MPPENDLWKLYLDHHSSELLILLLLAILMATLIIIVPQLLRSHLKSLEMIHQERMRALENGFPLPDADDASVAAGRTAMLVPMVVMICAGTVTCFLIAYKSESNFAIALSVWAVSGVVSLAAITGGVALIGRLAQLKNGVEDEEEGNPMEGPVK